MEQLTLFGKFEEIENLHDDNTIFFSALNWRAKFNPTGDTNIKRRADFYCSSPQQLEEIRKELLTNGWIIDKEPYLFPAISFSKADMLIGIYHVYG